MLIKNVITNKRLVAALGAGTLAATAVLVMPQAAHAAQAGSRAAIPVVKVHANKHLNMSAHHLRAGRVLFKLFTATGSHDVQVARIHKGYSLAQANQDIGKGFGGDAAAIRRVDKNVTFLGGATTTAKKSGAFGVTLPAGHFVLVDQNGGTFTSLTVTGSLQRRPDFATSSSVYMLSYGFNTARVLPASGVMHLGNSADQPHFVLMQRIKAGTTRAQLLRAFKGEASGPPTFLLPGSTESGILSPGHAEAFTYSLPAGHYVLACFWPDDRTGMVHAAMGMFKQVTLK